MDLLANTGAPLLVVNLVFAAIALALGFAAGAWVCGGKAAPPPDQADQPEDKPAKEQELLDAERTLMASDRLRDLAASVASDVGAHAQSMDEIEARLNHDNAAGKADVNAVVRALEEIAKANDSLQTKLADAEQQIQCQAELIRAHESEARTDSLTGLANRRAFDDELNRRFSEWERKGTPVSLLILDVDHFKKFNDTHGHQAGDEVLRHVAAAIRQCARDMDLSCRYGGEEFAVVMPATEGPDGGALVERIRTTIEAMTVEFEGKRLGVTTSLGLAGVQEGDTPKTLLKRADEALYASKKAGRNNAHRHNGAESVPITPGKAAQAALDQSKEESSSTLMLDSLPNRTRILEMLRQEVRLAKDADAALSLLVADFVGYRHIAEEFGEAVARLTLDSIAQFLDNAVKAGDVLGRLSEGQFIVMMPQQSAQTASEIGERINAALASCSVPLGDTQLRLQTAMTVTSLVDGDSAATLMARAESALQDRTREAELNLLH